MLRILLILCLVCVKINAQHNFNKIFSSSASEEGGFLGVGDSVFYTANTLVYNHTNRGFTDNCIRKFDRLGNLIDSVILIGNYWSYGFRNNSIMINSSNEVYWFQSVSDSHTVHINIFKTDRDLNILDSSEYRNSDTNRWGQDYADIIFIDSMFIMLLIDAPIGVGKFNILVSHLDTNMNPIYENVIEDNVLGAPGGYYPIRMFRAENHLYISGYVRYPTLNPIRVYSFLMKTDLFGNRVWEERYRYQNKNSSGSFIHPRGSDTIFMTQVFLANSSPSTNKMRLMYLDTAGNIIHDAIHEHESPSLAIKDVVPSHDGGYIITGDFYTQWDYTVFLWKVDKNFETEFMRYYAYDIPMPYTYLNYNRAYSVHEWPDSSITLSGNYIKLATAPLEPSGQYLWLLSVDRHGCLAPNNYCGASWIDVEEYELAQNRWTVYPNPASSHVYARWKGMKPPGTTAYTLTDNTGRVVLSGEFDEIENRLDLASFAPGLYFLRATDETGKTILQEKIVLQP